MPRETKDEDVTSSNKDIADKGDKARAEEDKIPEPGADPLHEGP